MILKHELEERNEFIVSEIEKEINKFIIKNYISIEKFLELESYCKDLCYLNFDDLFSFEICDYIDVAVKIYIQEGLIAVFPNNLFTALLMKNKLDKTNILEEEVIQMNEENLYTINEESFYYDVDKNSILYVSLH